MTKPMTAVAALALVREGRLRLDEPVDRLLPELAERRVLRRMDGPLDETVPADRPIIVRELLNFTFGFGATREMFAASEPWPVVLAANDLHLSTVGPPNPDEQPDPDTWMAGLGSLPLLAQPGERWLYSTGASVLGVLVAGRRGRAVRRRSQVEDLRTTGHARHGVLDLGHRSARDRVPPESRRPRRLGRTKRDLEPSAGLR